MTLGQRIVFTFVLVFVLLLLLAAFGYLTGRWDEAGAAPQPIPPSKWEDRIIELDKQALDLAYVTQMGHVFSIWVKDGVLDPSRARVGFGNARRAYNDAMIEIEKRERR